MTRCCHLTLVLDFKAKLTKGDIVLFQFVSFLALGRRRGSVVWSYISILSVWARAFESKTYCHHLKRGKHWLLGFPATSLSTGLIMVEVSIKMS